MLRMGVETLFSTHVYTFKGLIYKQSDGGPIGLRSTCAIARVVMGRYTVKWKERMTTWNVVLELDALYVDDGRVALYGLRSGWRWFRGGLWFCREWEIEDATKSPISRTKDAIGASMSNITDCLSFTVESEEDFESAWLPTLDMSLRVNKHNIIQYMFFEKPTSSSVCLQADTALSQNGLVQSLVEEVKRRMLTTSLDIPMQIRCEILDKFAQKMMNSGHSLEAARRNTISGIKGYESKIAKCLQAGTPINRSAASSGASRRRKKLIGKSEWFRKEKESNNTLDEEPDMPANNINQHPGLRLPRHSPSNNECRVPPATPRQNNIRTTSVLFVEQSKGGSLAKSIRETITRLSPMLGFNIKVVENAGRSLGSIFSNKNPWSGQVCGRQNCHPCVCTGRGDH